ncbi:hypothetical protein pdam_00013340, partial [Pocillopora damicornis]
MAAVAIRTCESPGCQQPAKLQCPTCIKLGIQGSFFCAQDCFKQNWSEHRKVHKSAKAADDNNKPVTYNPWPGYRFTGKLKPWPQPSVLIYNCTNTRKSLQGERSLITSRNLTMQRMISSNPQLSIEYSSWNRSVNEVICHGIPDTRPLEDGDLLNIDITIYYNGFHGDLNETFSIGEDRGQQTTNGSTLVSTMKQMATVMLAITVLIIILFCILVKPGVKYREIGNIIQKYAQAHGYAVVKSDDFNMFSLQDGKRSAQFEQTLLVTETECDILTIRPDDNGRPHFLSQMSCRHSMSQDGIEFYRSGNMIPNKNSENDGTLPDVHRDDFNMFSLQDGKRSAQFEQTLLVTETGCDILTIRPDDNGRPHFLSQIIGTVLSTTELRNLGSFHVSQSAEVLQVQFVLNAEFAGLHKLAVCSPLGRIYNIAIN